MAYGYALLQYLISRLIGRRSRRARILRGRVRRLVRLEERLARQLVAAPDPRTALELRAVRGELARMRRAIEVDRRRA